MYIHRMWVLFGFLVTRSAVPDALFFSHSAIPRGTLIKSTVIALIHSFLMAIIFYRWNSATCGSLLWSRLYANVNIATVSLL